MKIQRERVRQIAVIGSLFLLVCAVPAMADSFARIVRLSQVKGNVRILRALPTDAPQPGESAASSDDGKTASIDYDRAILNMPISQGMKISTGTDGLAEIEFEDGAILRIAPESRLEFPQLLLRSSGEKDTTIHLLGGTAYFNVGPGRENKFVLIAGSREIPLTHSARLRAEVNDEILRIALFAGSIDYKKEDARLEMKKGQEATIDLGDNSSTIAQSIEPGSFDAWDKERSEYHNTYYTAAAYQSYPYYGRGDLNNYGNWYSVSGYGSLWQPSNIGMGWNPFSTGAWSWNPGFGYMWASDSPWGWLPYHFGSWSFVPGWGWGWAPGATWGAPLSMVSVVNPPAGFAAPVPPKSFQEPVVRVGSQSVDGGHAGTVGTQPTMRAAAPAANVPSRLHVKPASPPVVLPPQNNFSSNSGIGPGTGNAPGNSTTGTRTSGSSSHSSSVHH